VPRLPQRVLRYQPIIDRLLAKDPADRYPSAAQFLEDLSAVSAPIRTSVEGTSQNGST
jgi:serine/threonine-protein kinase PpkA